jgi:hypothetical protein
MNQPKRWLVLNLGLCLLVLGCANASQSTVPSPTPGNDILEPNSQPADGVIQAGGEMLPIPAEADVRGQTILLEIAQTPRQQAIGLMFRDDLPDNRGMLFPFNPPRPVNFWMRNVQFPLDMIFLRNGEVRAIAPNVPPCTTTTCPTYGPDDVIDQVIEIKGGRAAAMGISVGDTVTIQYLDSESVP